MMRRLPLYTAVWYPLDDLPMESPWIALVAAITFVDVLFRQQQILAVKVWQGENPDDPYNPVWQDHPLLLHKRIKTEAKIHLFHFQNTNNATIDASTKQN